MQKTLSTTALKRSKSSLTSIHTVQSGETQANSVTQKHIGVWLIEDNRTFRDTIARVLAQADDLKGPRQFSSAEEALASLRTGPLPDIILLDVELPGIDGIEAVSRIKAISPTSHIIMLTVFDDHDKILRAICAGASGYLLKTSPQMKIIESIREVQAGGASMTPRIARSVLDMFSRMLLPKHEDYGLTTREREILELMTQGLLKKEIADRLSLSYHTVDTHLRNIYSKLHVNSRSRAIAKAIQEKLF
jgi:DNA-binding NarL/FixJ family response regulator